MIKKRACLFMVPPLTEGGGAEKYFINLAVNINKRFEKVDIVTINEIDFKKLARIFYLSHLDFSPIIITGREKENYIKNRLGQSKWIKSSFKDLKQILNQYDIIYVKNEIIELMTFKWITFKQLPPVIIGVHTPIHYPTSISLSSLFHNLVYLGPFYKWLLDEASAIHLSNFSALRFFGQKLKNKAFVIPYPFSIEEVTKWKQKYIFPNFKKKGDRVRLIFAGRLSEQKGVDKLPLLCNYLSKKNSNSYELNIFGTGDKENTTLVNDLTKKYSFVHYYGHVENIYMPYILSQQDALLAPSRWETMPFIILEAQSLGVPVLAYDIPGPQDIIESNRTGFLAKNDSEYFCFLLQLINREKKFNSKLIIDLIRNKFQPSVIYSKIVNLFNKILYEN